MKNALINLKTWYYGQLSWWLCRKFELKNKMDKINSMIKIQVKINAIADHLKPEQIKYQDGFTYFDKSKYKFYFDWGKKTENEHNIGLNDIKNVIWDKNSSIQFLTTKEEGDNEEYFGKYHYTYKTGMMTTEDVFNFEYGWIHCKMKNALGNDYWPAFWMLAKSKEDIPEDSCIQPEFDILEQIDGRMTFSMHYGDYNNYSTKCKHDCTSLGKFDAGKWYIMSLHWSKDFIKWYLNGELVKIFPTSAIEYKHKPHWLIFGDSYKGDVNKISGKDGLTVDWIIILNENIEHNFK